MVVHLLTFLLCLTDRSTALYFIRRFFIAISFPEPRHYGVVFNRYKKRVFPKEDPFFLLFLVQPFCKEGIALAHLFCHDKAVLDVG